MTPRPYKLGQRQLSVDQTRARIIAAARALLMDEHGAPTFTVDAVARHADIARMTVYYHFGSKRGLLEALFDELATRALVPHLRVVFQEPAPERALDALIGAFTAFWNSERIALRRARALAALDAEIGASVRARDERRREHLRGILQRIHEVRGTAAPDNLAVVVDTLHMLTSFETFEALLVSQRTPDEATRIVRQLAAAIVERRVL